MPIEMFLKHPATIFHYFLHFSKNLSNFQKAKKPLLKISILKISVHMTYYEFFGSFKYWNMVSLMINLKTDHALFKLDK